MANRMSRHIYHKFRNHLLLRLQLVPNPGSQEEVTYIYENLAKIAPIDFFQISSVPPTGVVLFGGRINALFNLDVDVHPTKMRHHLEETMLRLESLVGMPRLSVYQQMIDENMESESLAILPRLQKQYENVGLTKAFPELPFHFAQRPVPHVDFNKSFSLKPQCFVGEKAVDLLTGEGDNFDSISLGFRGFSKANYTDYSDIEMEQSKQLKHLTNIGERRFEGIFGKN